MIEKLTYLIKRYAFFLISLEVLLIIYLFHPAIAIKTVESASSSFIQMLVVLPPIMILLGLIDVWVPRETLMKYMGNDSGIIGIFLAMAIGSIAAGPMYAAFPFTAVLIKKGVKFSNVIIFMNAWCVTKISTLLFEISALGYKFTIARLIIDIPGVIIMGYLVYHLMGKDELTKLYDSYYEI
ncbi:MAG: permease [Clostridium sp.]|nr:permease [Clostridium sp.]MDU7084173.1 permease [Clostridium sp.]